MRRKNLQKERRGTRERGQPEGDGTLKAKRTEYFKREVVQRRLREWLLCPKQLRGRRRGYGHSKATNNSNESGFAGVRGMGNVDWGGVNGW